MKIKRSKVFEVFRFGRYVALAVISAEICLRVLLWSLRLISSMDYGSSLPSFFLASTPSFTSRISVHPFPLTLSPSSGHTLHSSTANLVDLISVSLSTKFVNIDEVEVCMCTQYLVSVRISLLRGSIESHTTIYREIFISQSFFWSNHSFS